jgi:hypothetical protein
LLIKCDCVSLLFPFLFLRLVYTSNTARARIKARPPVATNARRKPKQPSSGDGKSKKRRPVTTWNSDTMSSDSSDEDENGSPRSSSSSKRVRTGTPSKPSRPEPVVPNGLKKLPKGYVYDTEIHQSSLMNLSINPSQTGEYMEHLRYVPGWSMGCWVRY